MSLAKQPDKSVITGADGSFLTGGMALNQPPLPPTVPLQFHIRGKMLVFSPVSRDLTGRLDIFSSNGKVTFSFPFSGLQTSQKHIMLPELSPGISIIRIFINGKSYTRTLVSLDNGIFLFNESPTSRQSGAFIQAGQAAATIVDTLIASKSGYTTKKVLIDSYIKENIVIEMDTAGGHPYVIGTRLKVDDGTISEINTMVTDEGDWGFSASKYLSNSKDENWDVLSADKRSDRQTLIDAGDAYFDYIFDWSEDIVPWGDQCYRIEGGSMVARPCNQGLRETA